MITQNAQGNLVLCPERPSHLDAWIESSHLPYIIYTFTHYFLHSMP